MNLDEKRENMLVWAMEAFMEQFERVEWEGETYRLCDSKRAVSFEKYVQVRVDGEVIETKLSYTTEYLNEEKTERVLRPCVRIAGQRMNLDDERIEVSSESIVL